VSPTTPKKSRDIVPPVGPIVPVTGAPGSNVLPEEPQLLGAGWQRFVAVLHHQPP
jgi:hypothetical protein